MKIPIKCGPGYKEGETQEEGMRRRDRESKRKTRKWIQEIREREALKLKEARKLIEERIGSFDDVPL